MRKTICEKPQSGVTDTRRVNVLEHRPQPLGNQFQGLDPGVLLTSINPTATSIVSGQFGEELQSSASSRLAKLECQLIDASTLPR